MCQCFIRIGLLIFLLVIKFNHIKRFYVALFGGIRNVGIVV